jgi:hypothetical protein
MAFIFWEYRIIFVLIGQSKIVITYCRGVSIPTTVFVYIPRSSKSDSLRFLEEEGEKRREEVRRIKYRRNIKS